MSYNHVIVHSSNGTSVNLPTRFRVVEPSDPNYNLYKKFVEPMKDVFDHVKNLTSPMEVFVYSHMDEVDPNNEVDVEEKDWLIKCVGFYPSEIIELTDKLPCIEVNDTMYFLYKRDWEAWVKSHPNDSHYPHYNKDWGVYEVITTAERLIWVNGHYED